MSVPFQVGAGLIVVKVQLWSATHNVWARFALDTGATTTSVRTSLLLLLGYNPAASVKRVEMITASGIEYVPSVTVVKFGALGQERKNFPVLSHSVPPSAAVDGLLGLDFFQNTSLTLDFRFGMITLQ